MIRSLTIAVCGAALSLAAPAETQRRSREIQPDKAETIGVYKAKTIEPDKPKSVEPTPVAKPPEPQKRAAEPEPSRPAAAEKESAPPPKPAAAAGLQSLFRTFGLAIPGVAYSFDNYATNTRTHVVSTGALTKSAVRINPDGTFVWNSAWDERIIQGKWIQAKEGGAIILQKAQEGKDWRLERLRSQAGKAEVSLWDQNSIWYHGTPLPAK